MSFYPHTFSVLRRGHRDVRWSLQLPLPAANMFSQEANLPPRSHPHQPSLPWITATNAQGFSGRGRQTKYKKKDTQDVPETAFLQCM